MAFSFFKTKHTGPSYRDLLWIDKPAKAAGALKLLDQYPDATVVAWFNDTIQYWQQMLQQNRGNIIVRNARQVSSPQVNDKMVILLEHYPIGEKEWAAWQNWRPKEMLVLNSLDEPLFLYFGGERLTGLLQSLGLQKDECIEHKLVSKALKNAQEKLGEKLVTEHLAHSPEEWFRKNMPPR